MGLRDDLAELDDGFQIAGVLLIWIFFGVLAIAFVASFVAMLIAIALYYL